MAKHCNCENTACDHPNGCANYGGSKRMMYVGRVCDDCAEKSDPKYMIPEFRQPKPRHFEERTDIDPDQLTREEIHPDSPEFSPEADIARREWHAEEGEGPNSEVEYQRDMRKLDRKKGKASSVTKNQLLNVANHKNFKHRVDDDVDQINPEDIHPDALELFPQEPEDFSDETEEEYYDRMKGDEGGDHMPKPIFVDNPLEMFSKTFSANDIIKLAEQLEHSENEVFIAVENEPELLDKVAVAFIKAAEALREVAELTSSFESAPEPFTAQKLDEIAAVAEAFAESDDELLQKQASVLDDLLLTLASPKNAYLFSTADHDDRIEQLKKKYKDTAEKQQKWNHIAEAVKDIEKSPVYKEYRVMEEPLSTRYCPDHAGVSTHRVGEHTVRCALDGKTYNWDEGFTTQKGNKVPGSTVQEQNATDQHNTFTTFDSRATRMGYNPGE